jgi:hypothetical protein
MGSCSSVKKARPVYRTILDQIFSLTRKKSKGKESTPEENTVEIEALRAYVKPQMKGLIDHLEANKHKLSETVNYLEKLLEKTTPNNIPKENILTVCVLSELVANLAKFRPKNMNNGQRENGPEEQEIEAVEEKKQDRKKKKKMLTFRLKKKKKNKDQTEEKAEEKKEENAEQDVALIEKKLKKSSKKEKKIKKKKDKRGQGSNLNEHLSRFERSFFDITESLLLQNHPQSMIKLKNDIFIKINK